MADPKTYTEEEVNARLAEVASERDAIKANRDEALTEAKKAKAALKAYDGVDAAEYKTLKDAAEEADRKRALAEGNLDAWKKQVTDAHSKELGGRDTKIAKLTKALEQKLIDAELTRAIAAKKGEADLLLPYARQFGRVKETDDGFEGYIADERGNPLVADGKGTPMTFDLFVEQHLMPKFARAFDGTGSSGGGASKSTAGGGGSVFDPATATGDDFIRNMAKIASGELKVAS